MSNESLPPPISEPPVIGQIHTDGVTDNTALDLNKNIDKLNDNLDKINKTQEQKVQEVLKTTEQPVQSVPSKEVSSNSNSDIVQAIDYTSQLQQINTSLNDVNANLQLQNTFAYIFIVSFFTILVCCFLYKVIKKII